MPGQLKRLLGEHRPREQEGGLQARHSDDGDQGVLESVMDHHVALAQAPGPRRLDVVALHGLDDVDPYQADHHPRDNQAQGDGGEGEVGQQIGDVAPLAVDYGVDEKDVGVGLELGLDDHAGLARGGQPTEDVAEKSWASRPRKKTGMA